MIQKFAFQTTEIEGLIDIAPFVAFDERGYLCKDYSGEIFAQQGYQHNLNETFYTYSDKGVIRAIHFQRQKPQAKLVRCITGRIFDVVVDLRSHSKTFGKWLGFELSQHHHRELLIPGECGHGYLVLEPAIVSYKCSEVFYSEYDDGIMWNDPDIGIEWPLDQVEQVILSDKDKHLQTFAQFKKNHGSL